MVRVTDHLTDVRAPLSERAMLLAKGYEEYRETGLTLFLLSGDRFRTRCE